MGAHSVDRGHLASVAWKILQVKQYSAWLLPILTPKRMKYIIMSDIMGWNESWVSYSGDGFFAFSK
ncbi:hypothetical protein Anas_07318 [Armadillidium nasatum]|uniref:Uncharacterized protein n=1 Tax=Armadillidium nasatum TaxID=96803 RepID=A0A5N5SR64_9CRUS|nr:hypothetical protein Anas_07318 [Armadillidium nasatum]